MIGFERSCLPCGQPITDPDDAVYLGYEPSPTGEGWHLYAHRAHVDQAGPDSVATTAVARVLVVKALHS